MKEEVEAIIASDKSDYTNFTDFIKGAIRKEIDFQRKKIKDMITEHEG